jgi:hypothetical protein
LVSDIFDAPFHNRLGDSREGDAGVDVDEAILGEAPLCRLAAIVAE